MRIYEVKIKLHAQTNYYLNTTYLERKTGLFYVNLSYNDLRNGSLRKFQYFTSKFHDVINSRLESRRT